jgi:hypothetical protein
MRKLMRMLVLCPGIDAPLGDPVMDALTEEVSRALVQGDDAELESWVHACQVVGETRFLAQRTARWN